MKTTFYTPDVTESSSSSASLTPSPKYAVNPSPWSHSQVGVYMSIYPSFYIATIYQSIRVLFHFTSNPYSFLIQLSFWHLLLICIYTYRMTYFSVFESICLDMHLFSSLLVFILSFIYTFNYSYNYQSDHLSVFLTLYLSIHLYIHSPIDPLFSDCKYP